MTQEDINIQAEAHLLINQYVTLFACDKIDGVKMAIQAVEFSMMLMGTKLTERFSDTKSATRYPSEYAYMKGLLIEMKNYLISLL